LVEPSRECSDNSAFLFVFLHANANTFMIHHHTTAVDFANWDDMFDIPEYHNGLEILLEEGYSIMISFTGNRWYSTIIPLNETTQHILHIDYHAFWDNALSEDRTFLISEVTSASYPVEIDWYEMRRRINYRLREDVDFAYGPIGVLIPMVDYDGSGKPDFVSETKYKYC
jgi:hypothetical protein